VAASVNLVLAIKRLLHIDMVKETPADQPEMFAGPIQSD
jgi:hypothetical protein